MTIILTRNGLGFLVLKWHTGRTNLRACKRLAADLGFDDEGSAGTVARVVEREKLGRLRSWAKSIDADLIVLDENGHAAAEVLTGVDLDAWAETQVLSSARLMGETDADYRERILGNYQHADDCDLDEDCTCGNDKTV